MSNIALLTCSQLNPNSILDDHLLKPLINQQGHHIHDVIWDQEHNWKQYDAVIVRTTWDYQEKSELFFKTLKEISSTTRLFNPLDLMLWNGSKTYLKELAQKGVPTIPTLWLENIHQLNFESICQQLQCQQFIMKPTVGAGSSGLHLITCQNDLKIDDHKLLSSPIKMIQPFLPEIQNEGEFSLIFFNHKFSHAINKLPKSGEFRSQEEFGSRITSISPKKELLKTAQIAIDAIPTKTLYARVDLVLFENQYRVIELEMIEPNLYFSTHPDAAHNFVNALLNSW